MLYKLVLIPGNMKKILFLLFVILPLFVYGQTTYYVKPYASGGRDEGGKDGLSSANAWATLSYATTRVTSGNSEIYIASGNYTDNNHCILSTGVSIRGDSISRPIITTNYIALDQEDAYIKGYSSSLTEGGQSISYIIFDGNNWTATRGIYIGYRHNVDIHHCEIRYFRYLGVHYENQRSWVTPPDVYATGSNFHHNVLISNSGDRAVLPAQNGSDMRLDGQINFNVYECVFYEDIKPLGTSGDSFNLSFMKGTKIHDCDFYRHDDEGGQWNFYAEIFHLRGGVEIYNCNFYGAATLDFSNEATSKSTREEYDYCASVHDNFFTTRTGEQFATGNLNRVPKSIVFEKGDWEYVYIYNNHVVANACAIHMSSNSTTRYKHFYIYNNIFEKLGSLNYRYPSGIAMNVEGTATVCTRDNIHIWNNVIQAGGGYHYTGIRISAQGTFTNSTISNNIILGFENYPVYWDIQSGRSLSITNVDVIHNNFYNNGYNYVGYNNNIVISDFNITTGNIITNPLFISPTSFKLSATSPLIHAGINVGLINDYDGNSWAIPYPSIGAFEHIEAVSVNNYYVAAFPLGNDNTGDGSSETPWATLSYACSQVLSAESTIHLMTDIVDNYRAYLRPNVSIVGIGTRTITTNYIATSTSDAYLYLYSSAYNNKNRQSISYIRFNGNNLTATRAIWVGYRGNVEIHHCIIENFLYAGIHFRNQIDWTHPPTTYATGNSVHDNIFTNCSHMHTGEPAQLRLDGQDGMLIYNNVFDQRQRALGDNGANIRWTNVQNIKLYSNTFYKNSNEVVAAGDWNFFGELWHNKGDCEIYNNIFYGHATLDIAGFDNDIIAGNTFSYKIHDNRFLNNYKVDPVLVHINDYSHQYAITIEGTDHEYMYIYNNHIQRYGYGIEIATGSSTETGIPARNFLHDHFYIYNNIFEDMGYLTYLYSAAIVLINEENDSGYTNTSSNWSIVNNTMIGNNSCRDGIRFTAIGTVSNLIIQNNIITGFTGFGTYINKRPDIPLTLATANITYNNYYLNGNNAVYIGNEINTSDIDIITSNLYTNPLFLDANNGDFHLKSTSPSIRSGTYIGSWLQYDYSNNLWLNPPSRGVYEVASIYYPLVITTPITNITTTSAISGGTISSDGGSNIIQKGICWSINSNPTIVDNITQNGTGTTSFTSTLSLLIPNTIYYMRAYATNSTGTGYGSIYSFTTLSPLTTPVFLLNESNELIIDSSFVMDY